jgi:hypothetical protein
VLLLAAQGAAAAAVDVEARVQALAARGSLLHTRLMDAILSDPTMRTEWRRVGFAKGCRILYESKTDVAGRHLPNLIPSTVAAIHKYVPPQRLAELPTLSFTYGGLQIYRHQVESELDRTSGAEIASAVEDMRRTYSDRTRALPSTQNPADNVVTPKADIAAALGIKGAWNLDNPAQLGMACADLRIAPELRPKITTGARELTVVPPTGAKKQ